MTAASIAARDKARADAQQSAVTDLLGAVPVVGDVLAIAYDLVMALATVGTYPTKAQLVPWFVLGADPERIAALMASARADPQVGTARAGFGYILSEIFYKTSSIKALVCPEQKLWPEMQSGFPVCVGTQRARPQYNKINGERISEDNWLGQVSFWDSYRLRKRRFTDREAAAMTFRARVETTGFQVGFATALKRFQASRYTR